MSPERRRLIDEIFDEAVEQRPEERHAFLQQRCKNDPELRAAVDTLLCGPNESEMFLEPPVKAAALGMLSELGDLAVIGSRIGPYELRELVASGGMGTVYKALRKDNGSTTTVAVKLIRRGLLSPEMLRRFEKERDALARVQHPNIASLLDGGLTGEGLPYLVMEYVDGDPIDTYCDRMQLSLSNRLRLMRTVCGAVEFAHRNLVVHRDLKPNNVLVTHDGTPKLVDFGISKLIGPAGLNETTAATATGLRLARPQYASPEAIRGEPASTAMDVYSLGLILYELLTGHKPYDLRYKLPAEIQRIICDNDPTPPSLMVTRPVLKSLSDGTTATLTPEGLSGHRATTPDDLTRTLRGDLDTVVLTALHKDVARRYPSVERLRGDIDLYLAGFPIRAQKDTIRYRTRKFLRRHRRSVAAALVVLLALVGGVASATYGLITARREAVRSRLEAAKAEQVTEFLRNMLSISDPEIGRPDMTVKEVLDNAARRITGELAEQPEVRAAIHQTIGETYCN